MNMYKQDLAFNNQQWLICHKTKPNQSNLLIPISLSLTQLFRSLFLCSLLFLLPLLYSHFILPLLNTSFFLSFFQFLFCFQLTVSLANK